MLSCFTFRLDVKNVACFGVISFVWRHQTHIPNLLQRSGFAGFVLEFTDSLSFGGRVPLDLGQAHLMCILLGAL